MFLTLLAHNLEGSKVFYERLGRTFTEEQHGAGPKQWSVTMPNMTFELYPPLKALSADEKLFIGFEIEEDAEGLKRELIEKCGGQSLIHPFQQVRQGLPISAIQTVFW